MSPNTRRRAFPTQPTGDMLRRRAPPRAPAESARFYAMLPAKPLTNDVEDAKAYHLAIFALLHDNAPLHPSSASKLTRTERANLQRLERRWLRRAQGNDPRWNLAGAKPGRLPRVLEATYQRKPDPAWSDE